jgi:hypothetical protein
MAQTIMQRTPVLARATKNLFWHGSYTDWGLNGAKGIPRHEQPVAVVLIL